MTGKHTPGPWRIGLSPHCVMAQGSVDTVSGAVWGTIVRCEHVLSADDVEGRHWSAPGSAKANARLIAAAPDLLEALRPFAEPLTEAMENYPCHKGIRSARECTRCGKAIAAYEAIAKVEGRDDD